MTIRIYLEQGAKRQFACAVDWPGWARSGKTEEQAVAALLDYQPRYSEIVGPLGLPSDVVPEIVERVAGNATTDFGAPGVVPELDRTPISAERAERNAAVVEAAWVAFDETAQQSPEALRKGPRGGGRDRDKMIEHVRAADVAYARKLGIRYGAADQRVDSYGYRPLVLDLLRRNTDATPLTEKGWPVAYAARRIAWHSLDHRWEMEDRTT